MAFPYGTIRADFGAQYTIGSTKHHRLGTRLVLPDGRVFRYVENGGTLAVEGSLYQAEVPEQTGLNVQATAAVGAGTMSVTTGGDAVLLNDFAEGYVIIDLTPGEGYIY
ncbi:MAG: hypothetical protein IID36_11790, partial [Planctomycetes bacterium]|nr:hypothetical protein [Planctomycetota bacterium]